jgi:hypothetical protein
MRNTLLHSAPRKAAPAHVRRSVVRQFDAFTLIELLVVTLSSPFASLLLPAWRRPNKPCKQVPLESSPTGPGHPDVRAGLPREVDTLFLR